MHDPCGQGPGYEVGSHVMITAILSPVTRSMGIRGCKMAAEGVQELSQMSCEDFTEFKVRKSCLINSFLKTIIIEHMIVDLVYTSISEFSQLY